MWDIAWPTDVPTILSQSSSHSGLNMGITGPSSHNEVTGDTSALSPTSMVPDISRCLTTSTIRAPDSPGTQLSTEQLHPNPLVNAPGVASYRSPDPPQAESHFDWYVTAGTPYHPPGSDAALPFFAVAVPNGGHEADFRPALTWGCSLCPPNPATPGISLNHEPPNSRAGAGDLSLSQPTSLMQREKHHNHRADRHQRLNLYHPYAIPLLPPNYIDAPVRCKWAERPTQSPSRTEVAGNLASEALDWHLTLNTYEWLFAVMYPKRRPNKKKSTPSGQCQLCDSTCKRPGILQQHVTILHRQRIARKHLARKPYDLQLALAFVVAQVLGGVVVNPQMDAVRESQAFLAMLESNPAGPNPLMPKDFPSLHQKLDEFSKLESWVGVQCQFCGTWATRRIALEEHVAICTGSRQAAESFGLTNGSAEPPRLTASGLAARPSRGALFDR